MKLIKTTTAIALSLCIASSFAKIGDTKPSVNKEYRKKNFINDLNQLSTIYRTSAPFTCYATIKSQMGVDKLQNMSEFMIANSTLFNNRYQLLNKISPNEANLFYQEWLVSYTIISSYISTRSNAGEFDNQFCYNKYVNDIYANNFGTIAFTIKD